MSYQIFEQGPTTISLPVEGLAERERSSGKPTLERTTSSSQFRLGSTKATAREDKEGFFFSHNRFPAQEHRWRNTEGSPFPYQRTESKKIPQPKCVPVLNRRAFDPANQAQQLIGYSSGRILIPDKRVLKDEEKPEPEDRLENEFSFELEKAIVDLESKNKIRQPGFRIKSANKNIGNQASPSSKQASISTASYESKCNLVRKASIRSFKTKSKDVKKGDDLLQRAYKAKPIQVSETRHSQSPPNFRDSQIGLSSTTPQGRRWATLRHFCFKNSPTSSPEKYTVASGSLGNFGSLGNSGTPLPKSSYCIIVSPPKEDLGQGTAPGVAFNPEQASPPSQPLTSPPVIVVRRLQA